MSSVAKLVRDNITDIPNHTVESVEHPYVFEMLLRAKLVEEAKEIITAPNRDSMIEELGDLAEVIEEMMSLFGISIDEVRQAKQIKKLTKGGFKARRVAKPCIY